MKVFIDTSVYDELNFSFDNYIFKKLKELIEEGSVKLLYNGVVYGEVKQHIHEYLEEAIKEYNDLVKSKRVFAPYRNNDKWHLSPIILEEIQEDLEDKWEKYLNDCKAEQINLDGVDTNKIIDAYFHKTFPFERKKPDEFKDAIIVESIRNYIETESSDESLYLIAKDKGMRKALQNDNNINCFHSIEIFLVEVCKSDTHIANLIQKSLNAGDYDDKIKEYLNENVDDFILDVEDAYGSVKVENIDNIKTNFGFVLSCEDGFVEVMCDVDFDIEVSYKEMDLDLSYYDKEEKKYWWKEFKQISARYNASLELKIEIQLEDTDFSEDNIPFNEEMIIENMIIKNDYISLGSNNIIHREITQTGIEDDFWGPSYSVCPDCGKPISHKNDGGNGFCTDCAPGH